MRRQKLIILVAMIFFLSSTAIFSNVGQLKRRRITNRSLKDIYSIENYFPPQQQYVPGEIIVKFKLPLSDFEVAYLFGKFLPKIISGSRMANNLYLIRVPENCNVEQMVQVFKQNPYVKYAEPNGIGYVTADHSTQRIPNPPWEYGKLKPIKEAPGEGLPMGIESTHRTGGTSQFSEALNKEDMLHKDTDGETNQVLKSSNSGRKTFNKDNGIQPYPETNDNMRETQSSDNKPIIRSKTKIYAYRDSEGRLVITNYCRYKSKANK